VRKTTEKISSSVRLHFDTSEWLGDLLTQFRKKNKLDSWKDTVEGLCKELVEKVAERTASLPFSQAGNNAPPAPATQQPQQPQPEKRSFLTPSSVEIAYMKEKARQKARTEATLERAKQREEFRTQALADREEYEYALWKKRQDEKDRLTFRGPKVLYPGMG
jgi:hypothetical protein